jgi:dTMP kinase
MYVALEGGDGSGKSTVAAALASRLRGLGNDVLVVREPGGTLLGEAVRVLLLDSDTLDDWAEVFLFAAQRAELAREVIAPSLANDVWVISDRTYYSSIAYQGRGRGLGEDRVRHINEVGLDGVVPDHVFVLDVDPALALARQDRPDRIGKEGVAFQSDVRDAYFRLAEDEEKVHILDGSMGVEDLVDAIVAAIL